MDESKKHARHAVSKKNVIFKPADLDPEDTDIIEAVDDDVEQD